MAKNRQQDFEIGSEVFIAKGDGLVGNGTVVAHPSKGEGWIVCETNSKMLYDSFKTQIESKDDKGSKAMTKRVLADTRSKRSTALKAIASQERQVEYLNKLILSLEDLSKD